MKLAVVGATGFVGSAVTESARARGWQVVPVSGFRTYLHPVPPLVETVRHFIHSSPPVVSKMASHLTGAEAVVNAAGLADPSATDEHALFSANAVFATVVAAASAKAGISRLIHMSTAAVQGRRDPLDESPETEPFSPYSSSKALAEQLLLAAHDLPRPPETVVYRGLTDKTTIGREWEQNPFVRVWRGVEPEGSEQVRVAGEEATLVVWSPDYDGKGKALVRFGNGDEAIVGASRISGL
jgi:dTDP-4-dehydrorhamnose reductase